MIGGWELRPVTGVMTEQIVMLMCYTISTSPRNGYPFRQVDPLLG